jgi:exodeoxyribonuclease X
MDSWLMANRIIVRTFDLESTAFPPEGQIIEAGSVDTVLEREHEDAPWVAMPPITRCAKRTFFTPDVPCDLEARATHHITDDMWKGAPHHSTLGEWVHAGDPELYCAHNAAFELAYVQMPPGCFMIDTYKVALRVYPDFPRHTNQYLRYALELELGDEAMPPHRALPDAYTTAHIFATMLERGGCTLKEMIQWSREETYLTKIGFGKHFGVKYSEAPKDYLRWCLKQDMEPAVLAACRRELGL